MNLSEYYLTDAENEILNTYKDELLDLCCGDRPFKLIDLGVGDGTKTEILIRSFYRKKLDFEFIPVDISDNTLNIVSEKIEKGYPDIKMQPLNMEYDQALKELLEVPEKKLVLFLGSNLGNFERDEALTFLKGINRNLHEGDLFLIGMDLKKDPSRILNAYSDTEGITKQFNLNLLKRINEELGGNINLDNFKHYCTYDPVTGEVKSYLISKVKQSFYLEKTDSEFLLEAWEPIQTECSNKYDFETISYFAENSGFSIVKSFFDKKNQFTDSLWKKI
jgi:dimethylhistidine N-methyltransferase